MLTLLLVFVSVKYHIDFFGMYILMFLFDMEILSIIRKIIVIKYLKERRTK